MALVAVALLAVAVSACGVSIAEDGSHVVRSRKVAPFERIEVRGSTEVTVEHGPPRALRLEGGANRVHDLRTHVEGGTLVVEQEDSSGTLDIGGDPARVVVRAPRVEAVRIDGSGKVELRGLRGARLDASVYGSGEVRADGRVERLRSRVDGSGSLQLAALRTEDATAAISGSGSTDLGLTERLDAEIDGSGELFYAGDPEVSEDISGSGRIERR
jgi:Putative auto-transporter adhesin, head GIN domain